MSGLIVKEKAFKLYEKFSGDLDTFNISEGWLHQWKLGHAVRDVIIAGEILSADDNAAADFLQKFKLLVTEFNLVADQIHNLDEIGVNYKMFLKLTVLGTKVAKVLTIATCSNASGSHKMPLFVIGKSKKCRALKTIYMVTFLIYYQYQLSTWMDSTLFKE